jgi:NAD(P)H-flavin reductase
MGLIRSKIIEISVEENRLVVQLDQLPGSRPRAGQYILAYAPGQAQVLATPLYPCLRMDGELGLTGFIPAAWAPGMILVVRGPLGTGFELPPSARRVAVISFQQDLIRMSQLINMALTQKAAVVVYTNAFDSRLAEDIEVLPLEAVQEFWTWADYGACWIEQESLLELHNKLGITPGKNTTIPVEVLVETPLVCGGMADCGVCAVPVKRGYKLACKDGPVFQLKDLGV